MQDRPTISSIPATPPAAVPTSSTCGPGQTGRTIPISGGRIDSWEKRTIVRRVEQCLPMISAGESPMGDGFGRMTIATMPNRFAANELQIPANGCRQNRANTAQYRCSRPPQLSPLLPHAWVSLGPRKELAIPSRMLLHRTSMEAISGSTWL